MALTKIDDRGVTYPLDLLDNEKIRFGTGNDLEIYHDGSHSWIRDTGTGRLIIDGSELSFNKTGNTDYYCRMIADGAVELYWDGVKKFESTQYGATVHSHDEARFIVQGAEGNPATVYWYADDGDDNADKWRSIAWADGTFTIENYASGSWEKNIELNGDGAVELYYNNTKRFETTAGGTKVTGTLLTTGTITGEGHIKTGSDTGKFLAGASNDLEIYHDGSNSLIDDSGTGILGLRSDSGINLYKKTGNEFMIKAVPDGAVELYYDNVKTFETKPNGVRIVGSEGNYAYLYIDADEGDDNSDKWRFEATTGGDLKIQNYGGGAWDENIECVANGGVYLYYDDSKKFETHSGGINVTGSVNPTGNVALLDNSKLKLGTGDDLEIYHDGSDSYIKEVGTGSLSINALPSLGLQSDTVNINNAANSENMARFFADGAVELYYDNSKKLETTSGGVQVNGTTNSLKVTHTGGSCVVLERNSKQFTFNANYGAQDTYSTFNVGSGMGYKFYLNGNPYITINSSGVLSGDLNDTSDEKKKKNITSIPDGAIAKIKQLRPVNFNWKNPLNTADQSGFIAQEVKTVIPDLVSGEEYDEAKGDIGYAINTTGVVAHLTKALQEAITKIETLETEVAALKAK